MSKYTEDDLFCLRQGRELREALDHQEWCHNHVFDKELGEVARQDHDWDSCPRCDRISYDRRFPTPLSEDSQAVWDRAQAKKLARRARRAETRKAKRRAQRSNNPA